MKTITPCPDRQCSFPGFGSFRKNGGNPLACYSGRRMIDLVLRPEYRARTLAQLRSMIGEGRPLGYHTGEDFAFLALDATDSFKPHAQDAKRALLVLDTKTIVSFDLITAPSAPSRWARSGAGYSRIFESSSLDTRTYISVTEATPVENIGAIGNIDMSGVRVRDWAVLFYTEPRMLRSAVSFEADGRGPLRFFVAGLAPGSWDVWRDGWLEESTGVKPQEGSLRFNGRPGSYFLRRFG